MKQASNTIEITTRGPGLYEFTRELNRFVSASGVEEGLLTVFCRHTSASLTIQENADPTVRTDILNWMERIAPDGDPRYAAILGANVGADTDTVASIAAGICGAIRGIDFIPSQERDILERVNHLKFSVLAQGLNI